MKQFFGCEYQLLVLLSILSLVSTTLATTFQMPYEFTKALDKRCNCELYSKPYPKQFRTIAKEIENPLLVKKPGVLYRALEQWQQSWQISKMTDLRLKEAVKLFMATRELQENCHCSYCSFKILYLNLLSSQPFSNDVDRTALIPKMMRNLARKYTRNCAPTLADTYRDLVEDLDMDTQRRVSIISEYLAPLSFKDRSLTVYEAIESTSQPLRIVARSNKFFDRDNLGDILLRTMLHLDRLNPDNTTTLQQVLISSKIIKIKQSIGLFKELLLEPCKRYVTHFGGRVFYQAEYMFGVIMKNREDMESILPKDVESKTDFYPAWLNYRICVRIVDSSVDIAAKVMIAMNEMQHRLLDVVGDYSSDSTDRAEVIWPSLFLNRS